MTRKSDRLDFRLFKYQTICTAALRCLARMQNEKVDALWKLHKADFQFSHAMYIAFAKPHFSTHEKQSAVSKTPPNIWLGISNVTVFIVTASSLSQWFCCDIAVVIMVDPQGAQQARAGQIYACTSTVCVHKYTKLPSWYDVMFWLKVNLTRLLERSI